METMQMEPEMLHYIREGRELSAYEHGGASAEAVRATSTWRHHGPCGKGAKLDGAMKPRYGDRIEIRVRGRVVAGFLLTTTGWSELAVDPRTYSAGSRVLCGDSTGTVVASVMDEGFEMLDVRWDDGGFSPSMSASNVESADEPESERVDRHARAFARIHD